MVSKEVALKYLPNKLSKKDKKKQLAMLQKSRRLYKKHQYYTRKQVASYPHKTSKHILKARKVYKLTSIEPSRELSAATGCSMKALKKIVNKGEGAYYSSGSRPNQSAQSWGIARLASSVTGGKSAAVDFAILEKGCDHHKRAYKLAVKSRKMNKFGQRRVPKATL
jgi:DNA-binding Xre family transcriptional regulator